MTGRFDDALVEAVANGIWLELAGQTEPDLDFDYFTKAARAAIAAVLEWQGKQTITGFEPETHEAFDDLSGMERELQERERKASK